MPVTLELQIDDDVIAAERRHELVQFHPAVLETTCLVMPVRFRVDDRELFQTHDSVWCRQPVLGLAAHLPACIATLRVEGSAECSTDGDTLRFRRYGERVRISTLTDMEAETSVDELADAVDSFHRRVEELVRDRLPELLRHPAWPTWF